MPYVGGHSCRNRPPGFLLVALFRLRLDSIRAVRSQPRRNATRTPLHTASAETSHTYATWLVSAGVPINEMARVLGHGQITTTLNRYTHVLPNPEDRIRKAFDD